MGPIFVIGSHGFESIRMNEVKSWIENRFYLFVYKVIKCVGDDSRG